MKGCIHNWISVPSLQEHNMKTGKKRTVTDYNDEEYKGTERVSKCACKFANKQSSLVKQLQANQ